MTRAKRGEPLRFAHDVIENSRGPGPCILWPFGTDGNGYPKMFVHGKYWIVGRYIMQAIDGGEDKASLRVAHQPLVCHNPLCIRPAHLRWATDTENQNDRVTDGTAGKRVLTLALAQEIRSRYAAGDVSQAVLGREFGVSANMISFIIQGRYHKEKAS